MKQKEILKAREEELMNILWDYDEALTQSEMALRLQPEGWKPVTLYKTVQALTNAGYLEVVGLEKSTKTYARKLMPTITKEEYYTEMLLKKGLGTDSLANITAALLTASSKDDESKKTEVIAKLEEIVANLRSEG